MNSHYKDYATYLAERFDGKVQKLTVDAGFTCPNRDGTLGRGGCIYCNNRSFSPVEAGGDDIERQLEKAKRFFSRKYPQMGYLAYFQSYTNTYGETVDRLEALYRRALAVDGVIGLIIGTRPDCMPDELLERLAEINRSRRVIIEYGAETSHDSTLRAINRCHDSACTADAVRRTKAAGLDTGVHLILGLPGETETMMLETVDFINSLPVDTVKFHQLQVIKGTRLAADIAAGRISYTPPTVDEYVDLCAKIVRRLRHDIAIERFVSQSPSELLIAPRWGLKNYQFTAILNKRLDAEFLHKICSMDMPKRPPGSVGMY